MALRQDATLCYYAADDIEDCCWRYHADCRASARYMLIDDRISSPPLFSRDGALTHTRMLRCRCRASHITLLRYRATCRHVFSLFSPMLAAARRQLTMMLPRLLHADTWQAQFF